FTGGDDRHDDAGAEDAFPLQAPQLFAVGLHGARILQDARRVRGHVTHALRCAVETAADVVAGQRLLELAEKSHDCSFGFVASPASFAVSAFFATGRGSRVFGSRPFPVTTKVRMREALPITLLARGSAGLPGTVRR